MPKPRKKLFHKTKVNRNKAKSKRTYWNWPELKARYLKYEFINYEHMAEMVGNGLKADQIRKEACKGQETWNDERARITREAAERSRERVVRALADQYFAKTMENLKMAELLRTGAAESLTMKNKKGKLVTIHLQATDAIRAAKVAHDIEADILHKPEAKKNQDPEEALPAPSTNAIVYLIPKAGAKEWADQASKHKKKNPGK